MGIGFTIYPGSEACYSMMEEFRELSERHAAGRVAEDVYNQERHRIFVELGIETEDD